MKNSPEKRSSEKKVNKIRDIFERGGWAEILARRELKKNNCTNEEIDKMMSK